VLGTIGQPPKTTSSPASVHIVWLIDRQLLGWPGKLSLCFPFSAVVGSCSLFSLGCSCFPLSLHYRGWFQGSKVSSRRLKQERKRSTKKPWQAAGPPQQPCPVAQPQLPGWCREEGAALGARQGEASARAASAWDCLGNRNVRGQQRWDINNNINDKTNVKNMAVLCFSDYVEHFKTWLRQTSFVSYVKWKIQWKQICDNEQLLDKWSTLIIKKYVRILYWPVYVSPLTSRDW